MHPCESKRVSSQAAAQGLDEEHHPMPCETDQPNQLSDSSNSSVDSDDDPRQSCVLLNALFAQDIFELPRHGVNEKARFRPAKLPAQINLRNLNIQQIKYATISDLVIYAKHGLGEGVLRIAEQ